MYLAVAWPSDLGFLVKHMASNRGGPHVHRQDETFLCKAIPLSAHLLHLTLSAATAFVVQTHHMHWRLRLTLDLASHFETMLQILEPGDFVFRMRYVLNRANKLFKFAVATVIGPHTVSQQVWVIYCSNVTVRRPLCEPAVNSSRSRPNFAAPKSRVNTVRTASVAKVLKDTYALRSCSFCVLLGT